jgi:hypothetical protein
VERVLGSGPLVTNPAPRPLTLYKVGGEQIKEPGESSSTFITPGELPAPPPPIVFPSQHARDADTDERLRQHDIFMEYATTEEIVAFQRAMIKQGLMDEPPDDKEDQEPPLIPLRPAASVAQVRWARDMLAQVPHKSREQVERENHTSWEQLQHWARSSTDGLPERAAKKAKASAKEPVKKSPAKTVTKAKAAPKAKAKEA